MYEYECSKCRRRTERIENQRGPHLKKCPHCGGKVERLPSAPAIQFKGGGWYVSEYGRKSGPSSDAKAEKAEAKESADSKAGKEAGTAKDSKKPAKKD
jgi:putative FmdB family regulatory protein